MGAALRKHDDDFDDAPVSDINVTPLVDVMLVLLIVFMVAAPLMASGVPVDLPKTQAKPLVDQQPPIAVTLDIAGKYFVGSSEVASDQLLATLLNQAENGLDRRIHVRANKDLPYRAVLELMAQINSAGFTKVALVSDPPKASPVAPVAPPVAGDAAVAVGQPATATTASEGPQAPAPAAVAPGPAAQPAPPVATLPPAPAASANQPLGQN